MGRKVKDRTGERYGRLVVLERYVDPAPAKFQAGNYGAGMPARWRCVCDCGNTCTVRADFLKNGWTKSCGCLRRENARALGRSYGGPRVKREPDAPAYSFAALDAALSGREP